MNSSFSFKTLVAGLALSASALAQAPPPSGPLPLLGQAPESPIGTPIPVQPGQPVTQSSRIRAFNPEPDGQVHSFYLSNGNVINLSPDLSRQIGVAVTKGERVTVSGVRSKVNGQTVVAANSLTLHGQTFVAQSDLGQVAGPGRLPPPPPAGRKPGPGPRGGMDMARVGPQGPPPNGPGPTGPPPPTPPSSRGPRPPRPDRSSPATPPPPPNGNQPPAPTGPSVPAQPVAPAVPSAGQPAAPETTPKPNVKSFKHPTMAVGHFTAPPSRVSVCNRRNDNAGKKQQRKWRPNRPTRSTTKLRISAEPTNTSAEKTRPKLPKP